MTQERGSVRLEGVTKRYGDVTAVDGIDLEVKPAEFLSLLGPSGCGKTTTLRMLAGFEQPDEGRILVNGAEVQDVPPHRRDVNTVFQQYALFPHMSVFDNVAFGPRARKMAEPEIARRVNEMLEVVRLGDLARRRPAQLSGGQQQRVALARALVNYPAALLLDEPLAALDLKLREAMQIELKRIQREVGITFIFVTHDQGEALTMSDRIAVMSEARIEQIGTPEEVYSRPASLFVAGFMGSANLLPGTVSSTGTEGTTVTLANGPSVIVPAANCAAGASFSAGDRVTVMIRPENVTIDADGGAPLAVTDTVFLGSSIRVVGRLSNDTEVSAVVPIDPVLRAPSPGQNVTMGWHPGASFLLAGWPDTAGSTTTNFDTVEAAL